MRRAAVIFFIIVCVLPGLHSQEYLKLKKLPVSTQTYWECSAVPYKDGIVYISNKPISSMSKIQDTEKRLFSNIYKISYDVNGKKWGRDELLSGNLHSDYYDGPVCFAMDDNMLCMARAFVAETGDAGRNSNPNAGLYFSYFSGEEWSVPEPFQFNNTDYSYYTPYLTPGGDTLYFAAKYMEDSRGGSDIYMSVMKNGDWTEPVNLGDKVNSEAEEMDPFLHRKSGRLYFSSNGHDNFGGWDVFYCSPLNDGWSTAVKLPPPVNSGSDDRALVLFDNFTEGYFESKRAGGTPDIYQIYTDFPTFEFPQAIKKNRFCFRLRENSLDTIDYSIFEYEWVINDTLHLPGHSVKYCFPGPGEYYMSFNVTNKITDTVMYDQANLYLNLELVIQPVITCEDTVIVNRNAVFSAEETNLNMDIEEYYWDFGDGGKVSGKVVQHTYTTPGKYRIIMGIQEKVKNRRIEPEKIAVFKDIVVIPAQ